ncbi:5-formyltetrahydrofolate cyclo-ligase [Cronbergia sp. UHCC 0137]|uniref:5-formyltetrahydrofolate cyclo-ligase n=1 Tax=Cronbergia sp. UHCC 0137 TaxID=3110239 RepID=UPI002B210B61|nr:5-formyltetrahydrofolate cyclo-ligase [Cronbergia sp. UHCC 0137]MEA5618997.1 5-formyltetrahydrofolate cyclo-ligase [Cronbergia sp. UHCC 0137]
MEKINLQLNKKELRRTLLQKRQSMTSLEWREKSDRLTTNIQNSVLFNQAKTILAYFSFRQEPDISFLYTNSQKRWGFPRCVSNSLVWHFCQPNEVINLGAYGIREPHPESPRIDIEEVDLILVPCVGCDAQGYRLGYGGGYYDRLFSSPAWNAKATMGVVFDFAYLPQLPVASWDQPLKAVVTENGMKNFRCFFPDEAKIRIL